MRKPKPEILIREEYPNGTRMFHCVDDDEALQVLKQIRDLSRSRPKEEQSTFYTGRISWSDGYQ
jgi:hypothetical protein